MTDIIPFPNQPDPNATPTENTLRLFHQKPDVLDDCAANLFGASEGIWGGDAKILFRAMQKEDQQKWREKVIATLQADDDMPSQWQAERDRKAMRETISVNDSVLTENYAEHLEAVAKRYNITLRDLFYER